MRKIPGWVRERKKQSQIAQPPRTPISFLSLSGQVNRLLFAWLALHPCSPFAGQGGGGAASEAWESGSRASFEQNTAGACGSGENACFTGGPLSSRCQLEEESIAAHMVFSEARGLGLDLWECRGTGHRCLDPFASPSPQPLPCGRAAWLSLEQLVKCLLWIMPFLPGEAELKPERPSRAGGVWLLFLGSSIAVVLEI